MQALAVWSAVAGGAICATVAVVAVERMGGVEAALASLQGNVKTVKASEPPVEKPASVAPASMAKPDAPAFDIVRVEPSGDTVVAGHAAPHAAVELRDGDKMLAKVVADDSGQFAIVPDALAVGGHALQLAARAMEGGPELLSDVAPVKVEAPVAASAKPARAPPVAAAASPKPSPSPSHLAASAKPSTTAVAALVAPIAAPVATPSSTPVQTAPTPSPAPSFLVASASSKPAPFPSPTVVAALVAPIPASVATPSAAPIQTAPTPSPSPGPDGLRIAEAKPNDAGGFDAHGGAQPGTKVVLRLNGSYVAEVVADTLGRWSLTVERGLTAGFYALRAETLDASGKPTGSTNATFAYAPRAEPPSAPTASAPAVATAPEIKPVEPAAEPSPAATATPVMTASAEADPSHAVVAEIRTATVVKGDNLWDLARHFYGDGLRYSDIFHANASQIRDPKLIFIGQVFVVPQQTPAAR